MEPHGHLKLRWSGNVLYVQAVGPFNHEGAKLAATAYIEALNKKPSADFSVIEALSEESLGPPEAMVQVTRVWKVLRKEGCKALALVYSNAIQRELAEANLPSFGRTFASLDLAEQWVKSILEGP